MRTAQSLPGLDADDDGDGDEGCAVEERGDDLEAVVAVGSPRVGGPAADVEGEDRQPDGADVGEHVSGVGQEGKAVRQEASRRLQPHGDERYRKGEREPARLSLALRSARGDRKSTRLNSSHLVISYAVFCLKK